MSLPSALAAHHGQAANGLSRPQLHPPPRPFCSWLCTTARPRTAFFGRSSTHRSSLCLSSCRSSGCSLVCAGGLFSLALPPQSKTETCDSALQAIIPFPSNHGACWILRGSKQMRNGELTVACLQVVWSASKATLSDEARSQVPRRQHCCCGGTVVLQAPPVAVHLDDRLPNSKFPDINWKFKSARPVASRSLAVAGPYKPGSREMGLTLLSPHDRESS